MKTFVESIFVAFSMYSKIPMPQVQWNAKNMRYSLVVFPFVGAVLGAVLYLLAVLFYRFSFSPVFFAAAAVGTTVLITGGIHFDGYCDTSDALSSHREQEEKLRILKDPNVGAFAVLYMLTVLLLQFGAWHQIFLFPKFIYLALIPFIFSRSLAAWAIVSLPRAKNSGLASIFAGYASKTTIKFILMSYIVLCAAMMTYVNVLASVIAMIVIILSYILFYFMAVKQFGGITGDLAGFYIVVCETSMLTIAAVLGGLCQ